MLDGAAKNSWVLPNADGRGYYRFAQSKADLAALSKVVGSLSDAEQLAYADAVRAGFQHGYSPRLAAWGGWLEAPW